MVKKLSDALETGAFFCRYLGIYRGEKEKTVIYRSLFDKKGKKVGTSAARIKLSINIFLGVSHHENYSNLYRFKTKRVYEPSFF
ncbi:protein of unknown function [Legionella fallonii LLAP-10]|uniref:Uncharacterized protein n=1 Tax=Legionella fallonii LLAP-10 TaxID=1212491 RepID=A0A098G338_9GAMM|nr:protein of unknown function [Legionella fallonii LLAP-10]